MNIVDEPSHGNQNCGSIMPSYKWRDHPCYMKYPYICEQNGESVIYFKNNVEDDLLYNHAI